MRESGNDSPAWQIGYCTSGFAHHRLEDALRILADLGYRGVFLTLDVHHLDPFASDIHAQTARISHLLNSLGLQSVVETGARFILDPRRKHLPSLLSRQGAEQREQLLLRALEIAADLGAPCISTWSGANPDGLETDACWEKLVQSFERVTGKADSLGLQVGFEPEPGMFVETVAGYHDLKKRLGSPEAFGLSLDIGHLLVTGEDEPNLVIAREREELVAVAIEDMKAGVHQHLEFGDGDLDLGAAIGALDATEFTGLVAVELGRHSHQAVTTARRSKEALVAEGVTFGGA